VADVLLAERLGPAEAPDIDNRPAVTLSAAELARFAGLYWRRGTDTYRKLSVKDGALRVGFDETAAVLKAVAANRFAGRTSDLVFEPGEGGRMGLVETARSAGAKPVPFEQVEQSAPTAAEMAQYAGAYRSEEIEPTYRVVVEGGKLVLRRLKFPAQTLTPLVRDTFATSTGVIRFTRDSKGRVSGCLLNTGRVRHFAFTRLEGGH
jgi:hypothetical protein